MNGLVEKGLIEETGKRGNRPNSTKRYAVAQAPLEAIGVHLGNGPPENEAPAPEDRFPSGEESSPLALLGGEVLSLLDGAY